MYFLDTNTCIYYLNGQFPAVKDRLLATPPNEIAVPAPVKAELIYGAFKSRKRNKNRERVEEFLAPFEVVPFDDHAVYMYADIRFKVEAKGTPLGPNDLFIASISLHHDAVLVTRNANEFRAVDGLLIEDWTA